jgi:two-component system, NtrC family, response regulator HydG
MSDIPNILVVDDDHAHRTMLRALIREWQYQVFEADDGSTAIDAVQRRPFDLILMDVRMLKVSGIEALEQIKSFNPAIPVVIMTAYSSVDTAVDALKKGAYDYLTKPLDFGKLRITIERALEHTRLREENRILKESLGKQFNLNNIVGRSAAMVKLLEVVAQVAPSEATVLITGESGTGKELIAGAIHFNSPRKDNPFIKINCAAITETLLESELFGHEKGAFTGADKRKEGRFLQADKGTLFLDEVSEMSLAMQVKLLRVLQEKELTRVGGDKVLPVDVRVIAATNKDLLDLIAKGSFRQDLYYRLNVVNLEIPLLRKRREDIPLLAGHFLKMFADRDQKDIKGFTPQAMDCLIKNDWPGNVRELMNAVERGVVMTRTDYLDIADLHIADRSPAVPEEFRYDEAMPESPVPLDQVEKAAIAKTLRSTGGNKSEAARRLGITRKTLHKKINKYGIST